MNVNAKAGSSPSRDASRRSGKPGRTDGPAPTSPLAERVLFIDGEAIILDKPAGLPVDPPRDGALSLVNHLGSLCFGFARWPLAVHRLDRDTSGCLLLARNPKAHKRFTAAFAEHVVLKIYVAVVDGVPDAAEGMIDQPLAKHSDRERGWRMEADPDGKAARTHWQLLAVRDGRALLRFHPETGRTHQLRAHALHGLGLPIVGDPVYRREAGGAPWSGGLLLHALALSIPRAGKPPVEAMAPMPERFAGAGFTAADLPAEMGPDQAGSDKMGPDETGHG